MYLTGRRGNNQPPKGSLVREVINTPLYLVDRRGNTHYYPVSDASNRVIGTEDCYIGGKSDIILRGGINIRGAVFS